MLNIMGREISIFTPIVLMLHLTRFFPCLLSVLYLEKKNFNICLNNQILYSLSGSPVSFKSCSSKTGVQWNELPKVSIRANKWPNLSYLCLK